jgi:hypothetical protein
MNCKFKLILTGILLGPGIRHPLEPELELVCKPFQ